MTRWLYLHFVLAMFIAPAAFAGDGNPFPPQRVQIDFDSPFHGNKDFKYEHASVVVQFAKPPGNQFYELSGARPASVTVVLGAQRLQVPDVIVRDLGPLDLSQTKFEWGFCQYRLSLSGTIAGERSEIAFLWSAKDSTLLRIQSNLDNLSDRYPGVFTTFAKEKAK